MNISEAISSIGVVPVIKLNHPERDAAPPHVYERDDLCGDTSSFGTHQSQMILGRTQLKWFLVSEDRENISQHFMDTGTLSHISGFCTVFFFIIRS